MTARGNLSRDQFGPDLGDEESPPEMVKVSALMPHREWDLTNHASPVHVPAWDRGTKYGDRLNADEWEELRQSIKTKGMDPARPLRLEYSPQTHHAMLGEGNHRLQIAHEEGIESVPVKGVRRRLMDEEPGYKLPDPHLEPGVHFPAQFKVSRVLPRGYMA